MWGSYKVTQIFAQRSVTSSSHDEKLSKQMNISIHTVKIAVLNTLFSRAHMEYLCTEESEDSCETTRVDKLGESESIRKNITSQSISNLPGNVVLENVNTDIRTELHFVGYYCVLTSPGKPDPWVIEY